MVAFIFENEHDHLEIGYAVDLHEAECMWLDPKRAEWADQYAPTGPTPEQWMDNGYRHSCFYCEHMLSARDGYCDRCAGEFDEEEMVAEENELGGIVFDNGAVYCSSYCLEKHNLECQERKTAKEAFGKAKSS